jgi:hypothetical protein
MWLIPSLQRVSRTSGVASSEQAALPYDALLAEGVELAHMLGSIDWKEEPVQVDLCEACGSPGCASGGYVAIRRLGPFVVFAPSLRAYHSRDEEEQSRYLLPSRVIRKAQVPLVPTVEWERVRSAGAPLPAVESFKALTWEEAFLVAQFEAPHHLLGLPGLPRPEPLSTQVLATDPWLAPETVDLLGTPAGWTRHEGAPVLLREGFQPVSLILEDPLTTVDLFAQTEWGLGLCFKPGLALLPSPVPEPGSR